MSLAAKPGRSREPDVANNHVHVASGWPRHALRLSMELLRTTQEDRRDPADKPPCERVLPRRGR
ncbi:hypothetical protein GALMADRAFT_252091 [Galerina marginata CBS 339.88]|uniref:Uncharacterized protein n=1 Tax=Galerina marginata (strain CBS 339.88) TaxID=685588 RepID=A0A067SYP1_GALM3|nr:hypothetical protein GALMADRAFT_252091 [Galerina marginata CBS 339.88]